MPRVSHILVRYRTVFFLVMTVAVVVAALLVPHVNINTDMTRYLPDGYTMKQGLDVMEEQLPALRAHAQDFGSFLADGNDLLPTGLTRTLAMGVGLLFLVLLVMCSSVMEVGLFLVATLYAVALNMGTNAFLPSVSMLTNTLSSVLQMVLSMDYCIILMNRFRDEKKAGKDKVAAMEGAISSASSSILSSALTTVVSLLMLCFIRLKIGADLGVVLAKGVSLSLLCNFTVLPALILWGDKAVEATRKKVPAFPSAPVARFQVRWRYPITVVFLLFFVSFAILKNRTPLTFAPTWKSTATDDRPADNVLMLLYPTAEERAVPVLLRDIGADPSVHQTVSYPSLVEEPVTVSGLKSLLGQMAGEGNLPLPEDMLSLVYYAQAHPERTERFSFKELQDAVEELSGLGLVPAGLDVSGLVPAPIAPLPAPAPAPVNPAPIQPAAVDTLPPPADTLAVSIDTVAVAPEQPAPVEPAPRFTYEQATAPFTAEEMATTLNYDLQSINMVYRLAGKRKARMTPVEFVAFLKDKIVGNKRYAAFAPKGMAENVALLEKELQAALAAGPAPEAVDTTQVISVLEPVAADTLRQPYPVVVAAPVEPEVEEDLPPTPLETLMDMALSSRKYGAARVHRALSAAGVQVSREEIDLLYLYMGAKASADTSLALSPGHLLDYVADTLLQDPALSRLVPDSLKSRVTQAREEMLSQLGQLRGPEYSAALVMSGYGQETPEAFDFVDRVGTLSDASVRGAHYWIGESAMYKELKEGFPRELLLLTILTVLSIFLIVAINFRSLLVPIPLVMTIMGGIYVNVWASGLGGNTLYYLAYLIVQGILMGATIDYSILFTHYYLEGRKRADVSGALADAYKGTSHSILTSGLILSVVPAIMSLDMDDPMIGSILKSLSLGAFAILLLVLFLLPGVLAALDPLLIRKKR